MYSILSIRSHLMNGANFEIHVLPNLNRVVSGRNVIPGHTVQEETVSQRAPRISMNGRRLTTILQHMLVEGGWAYFIGTPFRGPSVVYIVVW